MVPQRTTLALLATLAATPAAAALTPHDGSVTAANTDGALAYAALHLAPQLRQDTAFDRFDRYGLLWPARDGTRPTQGEVELAITEVHVAGVADRASGITAVAIGLGCLLIGGLLLGRPRRAG